MTLEWFRVLLKYNLRSYSPGRTNRKIISEGDASMKNCLLLSAFLLTAVLMAAGCRSSASNCFTRNGSRVPVSNASQTVSNQVYPVENVIWSSSACTPCAANACQPCAAANCQPCAPNACDPCGASTTRTGAGYPMPGL